MFIFLTILILIAAILLAIIVVIQNSKGGGLASGFSTGNSMMGVRKTTDFLEKTTWWLTGTIIVLTIASTAFLPKVGGVDNTYENAVREELKIEQNALPNLGGSDQTLPMTPQEPAAEQPASESAE